MFRRPDLPPLLILALLLCAGSNCSAATATPSADFKLDNGEIEGARFVVARPAQWNGAVLLIAHGFRDEKIPLVVDFNPEQPAYRTLIGEGWIVAKTSYRRNGMIISDAIADLENLRAHIAATCGEPRQVVLEGEAMGGAIVTLIAEQFPEHYQGAVAVDAILQTRKSKDPLTFNLEPQIPLVFLTNQSELKGPRKYVSAPFDAKHQSLLLAVRRDGSGNVSQRERLVALHTLLALIDRQPVTLPIIAGSPPMFDATEEPVPGTSQVRSLSEGGFETRVAEVTVADGTLVLDAQPSDLSSADIAPGTWFELIAKGQSYRVLYGREPADAKRGSWVAFPNADGFCSVGRNHENAASTAGLDVGDTVIMRRLAEGPQATYP
jgi:hypothetical protein